MFKSIFSKYVTAFMVIIVMSFLTVALITMSVVGKYSTDRKKDSVENCADSSAAYIESMLHGSSSKDLAQLMEKERDNVEQTLLLISSVTKDISVVLCDAEGQPLLQTGSEEISIKTDEKMPGEILSDLSKGIEYSGFGDNGGMFENVKVIYAVPVTNGEGSVCGSVVACSKSLVITELVQVILSVVMGSMLWVLLAALIAVYFISERVIAPLREISSAAKSFAAGKFDVRVPVRGKDEVAELATAFNNMAESLDHYDDMRNSFMSNVSHDLRSPMTSISGFIDGILDGVIPPEQHKYYLRVVSDEIKRLSRLVNSLLDLSRIQAGERKFTPKPFDICEMARQILISFEQKINSKALEVEFNSSEDKIIAYADHDAVYQVFYNLCDNAVKFAKDGGKFSVSVTKQKGKKIQILVFNEGQGIAPSEINYVFERFYKSDKSRGLNKNGTGLGLFIAKTITEAQNGQIWVTSEYGKNCCFGFTVESE